MKLELIFIISLKFVLSWRNEGHIIMSNLIKYGLSKEEFSFFYSLTKSLQNQQHGRIKSFIEAPVWPDLLKRFGFDYFTKYHSFLFYINTNPFIERNTNLRNEKSNMNNTIEGNNFIKNENEDFNDKSEMDKMKSISELKLDSVIENLDYENKDNALSFLVRINFKF